MEHLPLGKGKGKKGWRKSKGSQHHPEEQRSGQLSPDDESRA